MIAKWNMNINRRIFHKYKPIFSRNKNYLIFILIINNGFKLNKDKNMNPKYMHTTQKSSLAIFDLKHIEIYLKDFN